MEWIVFIFVCWAAVRFLGVARCGLDRARLERRRAGMIRSPRTPMAVKTAEAQAPVAPAPAVRSETAEQRLRRRYVEGALTVEQYERELDALYRRI